MKANMRCMLRTNNSPRRVHSLKREGVTSPQLPSLARHSEQASTATTPVELIHRKRLTMD
jgi:hypothetical protein